MRSPDLHRSVSHGTDRLEAPAWAAALPGLQVTKTTKQHQGIRIEIHAGPEWTLIRAEVPDACDLNALDLQRRSGDAYSAVEEALHHTESARHPVRFWNFIPNIGEPMGDGLDRYMVFNAGRFAAFHSWPARDAGDPWQATASGVGHGGRDLVIWCLASREPGVALENPRQTPVRQYSSRYGPMPPSFSRATIIACGGLAGEAAALLVGGTASICGEQTQHVGQLAAQVNETIANLESLICAGQEIAQPSMRRSSQLAGALTHLKSVRVYWVRPGDHEQIQDLLEGRFNDDCAVEWIRADLCRPDLLVEIEGWATLEANPSPIRRVMVVNHA